MHCSGSTERVVSQMAKDALCLTTSCASQLSKQHVKMSSNEQWAPRTLKSQNTNLLHTGISFFGTQIDFVMKRHLKAILSVLVIFCFLPWMRALILSLNITKSGAEVEAKKDLESQITNGTLVDDLDSIEDLEPSSIKYLLEDMKKGSMKREFPIERHPESFFQVPFSFSFFTFFLHSTAILQHASSLGSPLPDKRAPWDTFFSSVFWHCQNEL